MKDKLKNFLSDFIELTRSKLFVLACIVVGLCLALTIPSKALTNDYPGLPTTSALDYDYLIFEKDNNTYLYFFDLTNGSRGIFYVAGSKTLRFAWYGKDLINYLHKYVLTNNEWQFLETIERAPANQLAQAYFGIQYDTLIFSSRNIYTQLSNGDVFFPQTPLPAPLTVEEMIAVEVPKMGEKIVGAMKTIVVCSVLCLAFLMGLVVLSKTLRIFRVR